MDEHRNWNAPVTLPRDTPVGAVFKHRSQPVLTPRWSKFNRRLNGFTRRLKEPFALHLNKPLWGRSVNHRRFMPPTMRIRVFKRRLVHQPAALCEVVSNGWTGLFHVQTGHHSHRLCKGTVIPYRREQFQVQIACCIKVFQTVRRGRVHSSGTRF